MSNRCGPNPAQHFYSARHETFFWRGGAHAALLIHGFPGTPAEMRPLAALLNKSGWTVCAPLLPGFGAGADSLSKRKCGEWIQATQSAYEELQRDYRTVLLIGNSMGGALAVIVAATAPPAGMVLLAPFTRLTFRWDLLWHSVRRWPRSWLRGRGPMIPPEAARPAVPNRHDRHGRRSNGCGIVRALKTSLGAVHQVRQIGRLAFDSAERVANPTLVLQGQRDWIVKPRDTQRLSQRFAHAAQYVALDGGHDLFDPDAPAWPEVARRVTEFAQRKVLLQK